MPNAGERAYAYTKACGIIGKSFVGKRISALADVRALPELDRLIFPGAVKDLPGQELLNDLERRIVKRAVKQILSVINSYANPPKLLVRQLRSYEYSDLKTYLNYLAAPGKDGKSFPPFTDIGRFRTFRFEAFPDLKAMLEDTEGEFILSGDLKAIQNGKFDPVPLETELDLRYYLGIKDSLKSLHADDRHFAERILAEEISLRNCVWALRLRTYYKKTAAETAPRLMDIRMRRSSEIPGDLHEHKKQIREKEISLSAEALQSLEFPLDSRSAWHGWRWEKFLNPETGGEIWEADPRWFQNAASEYLYQLSLHCFHSIPFAISTAFCYIKLKQFEEDLLISVAEGLGLGMSSRDVFELLEVAL
jgi:vacuolar-type H+-ATPase subunit C/Vma6